MMMLKLSIHSIPTVMILNAEQEDSRKFCSLWDFSPFLVSARRYMDFILGRFISRQVSYQLSL
jgi:hypothetical protein